MAMATDACWVGQIFVEPAIFVSNHVFFVEPGIFVSNRAVLWQTSF